MSPATKPLKSPPICAALSIPPVKPISKLKPIKTSVLVKNVLLKSAGKTFVKSRARNKPYSPKMAPDAPTLTDASYHQRLAQLATIPVNK